MHLLYLDDSGSVGNASDKHIILAGFSASERTPHWLSRQLDAIAARYWPDNPQGIEFRGTDILGGKKHWRGLPKPDRHQAYCDALRAVSNSANTRLFGAAIYKAAVSPSDPMEIAFEHVVNRFDRMLGRFYKNGDTQRGLIVLDESSYETSLQRLATTFRTTGHQWGQIYNLAEVPLFVNSKATRLIQYADLIAHALRRYYDGGDATYFDIIKGSFDSSGGVVHGLIHHVPKTTQCNCPCCFHKQIEWAKPTEV